MHTTSPISDPLPVRMINEFVYCRRLFHLMQVEGLWEDNHFTKDGQWTHRRIDAVVDAVMDGPAAARQPKEGEDSSPEGDPEPEIKRSITLSSERLGIIAKLDLVATDGDEAVPVETKRGRTPSNPERSWEPERVQVAAQALLLREHGYRCTRGVLYFAGSRTRVDVPITEELEARTLRYIEHARQASMSTVLPPPLDESPKCLGCSLAGICLPDETNALAADVNVDPSAVEVRRLYPARDDAQALYVQEPGAKVGKTGEALIVRSREGVEMAKVPLKDVSELVLCGNVSVSAPVVHLLCESGIPIVHVSGGHWFYGVTAGVTLRNAYDRAAQFAAAADPVRCMDIAREFVMAKGANQRTLLRRNGTQVDEAVAQMSHLVRRAESSDTLDELLGVEGNLARVYFGGFATMLRSKSDAFRFDFDGRNRRPPKDPVNALLSFGYAMLVKECVVALLAAGLDPYWGFYHQPRHGRPALALDLMEEFRPLIVDSAVITAINTGVLDGRNFVTGASGCALQPSGRKKFIQVYASRLDQLVTHPKFDYRCSWRQIIHLQARILARHLRGDIRWYEGMTTR